MSNLLVTDWEPGILLELVVLSLVYSFGVWRVWQRAGRGHGISSRQVLAFSGAVAALTIALASPLDTLSESAFSMHMIQHMLLIVVAAPLLVVSGLPLAVLWTLPRSWSHDIVVGWRHMRPLPQLWRFVNRPLVAWTLFAGSLWLWHIPVLYDVALSSGPIHAVEHFLFLGTSALCWWILLKPSVKKLARYGVAVLFLFTTAVQSSILGALLAFSAYPWYPSYATSAAFTSLTPLEDQQLAGLIMWLPMGTVYMISAILFFGVWLNAMEHESQRPENPASTGRS